MAWAATKTTTGAGNWNAAIWNPVGVPGQDDYVTIEHAVSINCNALAAGLYVDNAVLTLNPSYDLTIKDAAGTHTCGEHIRISSDAGSGIRASGATATTPFVIKSQNVAPTYPIKIMIQSVDPDARDLNFDYVELRNLSPSLGHTSSYLFFNTGNVTTDGILDPPTPIRRDQKIDEIYCEGRDYGRIYPEGGHAGVMELSGLIPWTGYLWTKLNDLRDQRSRIAFTSQFVTMPKALIESLRFGQRDGPYLPFSITLVEYR